MKARLNYTEIYITNVCNYSCDHCQSFNNFLFKGHQRWKDYKYDYQRMSEKLDIDCVQIIGGEPTLNPDFKEWVTGISQLWPKTKLQISTNGSNLARLDSEIYDTLCKHKGTLWITCHDIKIYADLFDFSTQFLDNVVSDQQSEEFAGNWHKTFENTRRQPWPECSKIEDFDKLPGSVQEEFVNIITGENPPTIHTCSRTITDKNGVEVKLDWSQSFVGSAVDVVDKENLKMKYNSDPIEAHDNCYFKVCHQMNKGKLYKCPLVSTLPDFLQQFNVKMSEDDYNLAMDYQPASGNMSQEEISEFVNKIENPINQCKFCPAKYTQHNFQGTSKKPKNFKQAKHKNQS